MGIQLQYLTLLELANTGHVMQMEASHNSRACLLTNSKERLKCLLHEPTLREIDVEDENLSIVSMSFIALNESVVPCLKALLVQCAMMIPIDFKSQSSS